jgi:hypothetical protein
MTARKKSVKYPHVSGLKFAMLFILAVTVLIVLTVAGLLLFRIQ